MIFSRLPIEAICSFGTLADRSAFPSLVQTTKVPVSADPRNCTRFILGVGIDGSAGGSAIPLRFRQVVDVGCFARVGGRAVRANTLSPRRCAACARRGTTTWLGSSLSSCWNAAPPKDRSRSPSIANRGPCRAGSRLLGQHRPCFLISNFAPEVRSRMPLHGSGLCSCTVACPMQRGSQFDLAIGPRNWSRYSSRWVSVLLLDVRSERPKLFPFWKPWHLQRSRDPCRRFPRRPLVHAFFSCSGSGV